MNIHGGLSILAVAAVLVMAAPTAWADRGHEGHDYRRHDGHGWGHGHGLMHRDERGRHAPRHSAQVHGPQGHWLIPRGGVGYHFSAGSWYWPWGPRLAVTPPVGAVVSVVPAYAITVWSGGITYYYADGVYFVWNIRRHGYVVSAGPSNR